jgi:hypothetical protein
MTSGGAGATPTWTDLSTIGVTSITATAPITASASTGAVTIGVNSTDLTSTPTTSAITVTGGTGVLLGSTPASISLATNATLAVATSQLGIDLTHANSWTVGTQTFATVAINGGSIDGTTVGLTTPSTVKTTGLTMSSTTSPITLNASVGTAGQVLTSAGAGATPAWTNPGAVIMMGSSTPTAFAADADPMAITATQSYYRISATPAPVNIKGISGGAAGRVIVLANVGTFAITLVNAANTDANDFKLQGGDNVILGVDGTATLIYDGTDSRWRVIANY